MTKAWKTITAMILCVVLICGMTACGEKTPEVKEPETDAVTEAAKPIKEEAPAEEESEPEIEMTEFTEGWAVQSSEGWKEPKSMKLTEDLQEKFDRAMKDNSEYTAKAYLGDLVTTKKYHRYLCVKNGEAPQYAVLEFWQNFENELELRRIITFDSIDKYTAWDTTEDPVTSAEQLAFYYESDASVKDTYSPVAVISQKQGEQSGIAFICTLNGVMGIESGRGTSESHNESVSSDEAPADDNASAEPAGESESVPPEKDQIEEEPADEPENDEKQEGEPKGEEPAAEENETTEKPDETIREPLPEEVRSDEYIILYLLKDPNGSYQETVVHASVRTY